MVAVLAQKARPRYHIAAAPQLFHQRAPYMNQDLGTGSHATRFISLASVGNAAKAKWAHALQLTPCERMSAAELTAKPADATASPYTAPAAKRPVRRCYLPCPASRMQRFQPSNNLWCMPCNGPARYDVWPAH